MDVRALVDRAFDFRRINFSVRARQQQNFAAVRKKFRRAALGSFDVLWLFLLTVVAIASRPAALRALGNLIRRWQIDPLVVRMAARQEALVPYPPPGAAAVVRS